MKKVSFSQQHFVAVLLFLVLLGTLFVFPNFNAIYAQDTTDVWINEIHYDNVSTDVGEFVELAGNAGTNLTGWSIVLYNGNNGAVYNTTTLSGAIPDQCNGFGTSSISYPSNGIQNGAPDGIALVYNGAVIQFLSYEGSFVAVGGPADGTTSTDIGVSESGSDPIGESLQLTGDGTEYSDFVWVASAANTQDTVNNGQSFAGSCNGSVSGSAWINEIHYDNVSTDVGEFVELAGNAGTNLTGWSIVLYNGNNGAVYNTTTLSGAIPDQCNGFGTSSISYPSNGIQNGAPDGIALVYNGAVIQFLSYEGSFVAVGGPADGTTSTDIGVSESGSDPIGESLQLTGDGTEYSDFVWVASAANTQDTVNNGQSFAGMTCTPPITPLELIHTIQGSNDISPLAGATISVEAIVVGDFQDILGADGDLNGFYLQEEDSDADGDITTSEGIFVYEGSNPSLDLSKGDLVRVTGTVGEYSGQTQISNVSEISILSSGNYLPTTSFVALPITDLTHWERYEGMRITVQGTTGDLTVNDTYDLGRYGSFQLSSGGRVAIYSQLYIPTDSDSFNAYHEASRLRTIVVDDGRTNQNPDPTPIINGANFDAINTVRSGYTTTSVTGILNYSYDEFRIHPTEAVNLTSSSNARTPQAPFVGGNLRVASFNLLNYFNGNGMGGGFPTARGANTFEEYERQHAKTIAALVGLDADIIGVIELENDYSDGIHSAAQDLVNGLNNAVTNCGPHWAYVNPGVSQLGDDAIAVGFLYCASTVSIAPNTAPAILDDSQLAGLGLSGLAPVFNGTNTNRASLAVTFLELASNSDITVVVNHFKSKGGSGTGLDADTGNGVGSWNQRRRDAATALNAWLTTHPTGTDDGDALIIGDLNSYSMEDPLLDLAALGYANLVDDAGAYSYGYPLVLGSVPEVQGWGTLDYALANSTMELQVTDATEWHINSDEPVSIDYNTEFKYDLLDELYSPDAYRASDHDPLVIGMTLNLAPTADFALVHPEPYLQGETVHFVFSNISDEGGNLTFAVDCTADGVFDFVSDSISFSCDYAEADSYTVSGRVTDEFGDSSVYTLHIQILSPLETISYLNDLVDDYGNNGLLNRGQTNALGQKLTNIARSLEYGNLSAALSQIQGFVDQVQDFINEGVLPASEGNTLIYLAYRLIAAVVSTYGS